VVWSDSEYFGAVEDKVNKPMMELRDKKDKIGQGKRKTGLE